MKQQIGFCKAADGARIGYATVGEGPPLLKAPNWLTHLEYEWSSPSWRHWWEELAKDHRLVRFDQRGSGLSDWSVERSSFEDWVSDMEAVAVEYAVRHPERVSHLILFGAFPRGRLKRGEGEEEELFMGPRSIWLLVVAAAAGVAVGCGGDEVATTPATLAAAVKSTAEPNALAVPTAAAMLDPTGAAEPTPTPAAIGTPVIAPTPDFTATPRQASATRSSPTPSSGPAPTATPRAEATATLSPPVSSCWRSFQSACRWMGPAKANRRTP